jgi:hypothetical protein
MTSPGKMRSPAGERKMSEVLLQFIEPYRELAQDDAALKKLIALGVVAWNTALLPESERGAALDEFGTGLFVGRWARLRRKLGGLVRRWIGAGRATGDDVQAPLLSEFKEIVHEMIGRKIECFAHNRRCIVSCEVNTGEEGVHLVVVSTLHEMDAERCRG